MTLSNKAVQDSTVSYLDRPFVERQPKVVEKEKKHFRLFMRHPHTTRQQLWNALEHKPRQSMEATPSIMLAKSLLVNKPIDVPA